MNRGLPPLWASALSFANTSVLIGVTQSINSLVGSVFQSTRVVVRSYLHPVPPNSSSSWSTVFARRTRPLVWGQSRWTTERESSMTTDVPHLSSQEILVGCLLLPRTRTIYLVHGSKLPFTCACRQYRSMYSPYHWFFPSLANPYFQPQCGSPFDGSGRLHDSHSLRPFPISKRLVDGYSRRETTFLLI